MPETRKRPQAPSRRQILESAQGLVTQNFDRQEAAGTILSEDGRIYFMLIGVRGGDVLTNVSVVVTTAGAGTSLSKVGLYTTAGVRLALSADQGTGWNSAGVKTIALGSPYTVTADGGLYVAVVAKAATTLPTFLRSVASSVASPAIGAGVAPYGSQTGQTDLPASATIGSGTHAIWVGLS
jgi:hypothetical protein